MLMEREREVRSVRRQHLKRKFGAMSRKLLLTQKQITAICKGASKAGYVPIIETEGLNVRLVPEKSADDVNPTSNEHIDDKVRIRF